MSFGEFGEEAVLWEEALKLPRCSEMRVSAEYIDDDGFMEISQFGAIGNYGTHSFWEELGLRDQLKQTGGTRSTFMLQEAFDYFHGVVEGEELAVYAGLYDFDPKKLHYFVYTVSLTHKRVVCIDERLEVNIDMTIRRSSPFDPEVLEKVRQVKAANFATGWQPVLSGAIRLRK